MQPERCRGLFFIFMRFFRRITTTFSDIEEIGSIMKKRCVKMPAGPDSVCSMIWK